MAKDKNWDIENFIPIDVSGKSYVEAIAVAKEHLGFFIKVFEGRAINLFNFYIKARFEDNEHIEHLWLKPISLIDDNFNVIVDNVPKALTTIKYQDSLQIRKCDVEDWIILLEDGELFGNFIAHALGDK